MRYTVHFENNSLYGPIPINKINSKRLIWKLERRMKYICNQIIDHIAIKMHSNHMLSGTYIHFSNWFHTVETVRDLPIMPDRIGQRPLDILIWVRCVTLVLPNSARPLPRPIRVNSLCVDSQGLFTFILWYHRQLWYLVLSNHLGIFD